MESGLKVGDQIVTVDGHSVRSVTHAEALGILRESGVLVQLEVANEAEEDDHDADDDRIDEHIMNSELDQEDVKVVSDIARGVFPHARTLSHTFTSILKS